MIALNTLLFIHKVRKFSVFLPASINLTIFEDSPVISSTHETCKNWLEIYNSQVYRNSVFSKGPLLYISAEMNDKLDPTTISSFSLNKYEINLKKVLLDIQGKGINLNEKTKTF